MPRGVALVAVFISSACAGLLPERLGPNQRATSQPVQITTSREVWDEYGLQAAERADYGRFRLTVYQFKDTTGSFAAGQWLQATETGVMTLGNYVVSCAGKCPPAARLTEWLGAGSLPKLSRSAYPTLETHLPRKDLIGSSRRYIVGPVSLAQFEPRLPASDVAFDFSPEAQLAKYRTAQGEQTLLIISYPTPQIARQQAATLEKVPGMAVKRTGPMVAVVVAPADRDAAGLLLSQIDYQASVSFDGQSLGLVITPVTAAKMLIGIITLAGVVLCFCLVSGLAFGGIRIMARRFGYSDARTSMITLHLSDKITPRISPR